MHVGYSSAVHFLEIFTRHLSERIVFTYFFPCRYIRITDSRKQSNNPFINNKRVRGEHPLVLRLQRTTPCAVLTDDRKKLTKGQPRTAGLVEPAVVL